MSEKYLACCLNSLANQSVQDIEIICINDCSPDGSLKILESFAEKDPRFILIDFEKNRGPGAARNAGMAAVSGNFIRMVDSDDYLPYDSTEKLLHAAEQYSSDFVRGGYWNCSEQGQLLAKGWNHPEHTVAETQLGEDKTLWGVDQHWTYLYRTETLLATGIQYDESMRNAQDAAFRVDLMPHMKNITSIAETVYYYRNNPASIMRSPRNETFFQNVLSIYDRAYSRLGESGLTKIADYIFYTSLCNYLPKSIFPTIFEDLEYEEAKDIVLGLKALVDKHQPQKLCLNNHHAWQCEYRGKLPIEVKYLILLLQNNHLPEAYNNLSGFQNRSMEERDLHRQLIKQKNRLKAIQNSTSWKITAPLRRIASITKKAL